MQGNRDLTLLSKRLLCLAVFFFSIMVCTGGESSESKYFFNFIKAVDPQNVLNISKMGSTPHPCLLKLNGVRCNSSATNIMEIKLENLNLSGKIDADSLCRLQKLRVVNLAKNYIQGNIPNSILHCTRLMYLNLSSNLLSGRLPKALTKLKNLRNLDISNNKFSGIIPSQQEYRQLLTYYATSRISESNSIVLLLNEEDATQSMSDPTTSSTSSPANTQKFLPIHTLVILLGVGLFLISLYFAGKKLAGSNAEKKAFKNHEKSPIILPEVTEGVKPKQRYTELVFFVEEHEQFTLEDLLRSTADLQNESFCSSLYMVKIKNSVHYAVKRLKNLRSSFEEFGETLRQISRLKHPNILPLVGYHCTSEEKLLIYKYQSNGSLLNLLKDFIAGKKDFPWKPRLSIACGIARGLSFIYQKLDGREIIPHGNLKLSNILLNDNNEPLISEHGLSKFLDPNRAFPLTSLGYTAPEQSLTEKGDVYSFGVILLELLTGKSLEVNRIDLPRWVRSMVREEWTGEIFDKEVREADYQWAFPVLNIALTCVSRLPEDRPTMEEVLQKMEEVMHEHEEQERLVLTCCSNESNHADCCTLHTIIPDTWDSPGSNY